MPLFKQGQPFSERVYESVRGVAADMNAKLAEAKTSGLFTDNAGFGLSFAVNGALALAFRFLAEEHSPLRRLRPSDLPYPQAPIDGYLDLISAMFHQLQRDMDTNSEFAAKLGMSHLELIRIFCEVVGLDDTYVADLLLSVTELHAEDERGSVWDVWIAYFRETLTGKLEGIRFDDEAWKKGYDGVLAFYALITSLVVNEHLGVLRSDLEMVP